MYIVYKLLYIVYRLLYTVYKLLYIVYELLYIVYEVSDMIVSSRSWHIAHTASSSLLINEDDDGHFLSFVLMCVDIVECELARTAHNFGVVISWNGV